VNTRIDVRTVGVPATATPLAVEQAFATHDPETWESCNVNFDLSECRFIEVPTLVYLIATLTARSRRGLHSSMTLPRSKDVRDFLREWLFPDAVRDAVGLPFSKVVVEQDVKDYFGENRGPANPKYGSLSEHHWFEGQVHRVLSGNSFGLVTYFLQRLASDALLAMDESKRWQDRLVRSVLKRHLGAVAPSGFVASRIVFEAMTNAVRHPKGTLIQTGSRFVFPKNTNATTVASDDASRPANRGHLILVFWDDGDSMIDTLRRALIEDRPIRSGSIPNLDPTYAARIVGPYGEAIEEVEVRATETPNLATRDELLLLATTFPGITRDVEGLGRVENTELRASEPLLDAPGMGLYVLLNAVIDVFGGSVGFRTKNLFMSIKRSSVAQINYDATIHQIHANLPTFVGNLVTVRLPLAMAS
jgi:hypothetical protein